MWLLAYFSFSFVSLQEADWSCSWRAASLQGLSESVSESFLALLGEPSQHQPDTEVVEPMDAVWKRIAEIRKMHGLEQGTR